MKIWTFCFFTFVLMWYRSEYTLEKVIPKYYRLSFYFILVGIIEKEEGKNLPKGNREKEEKRNVQQCVEMVICVCVVCTVSIDCKLYWCKYLCVHSCICVCVCKRVTGNPTYLKNVQVYGTCFTCYVFQIHCISHVCVRDVLRCDAMCDCIILRAFFLFYFIRCNKI